MEFQQQIDFESLDAEKVDSAYDEINHGNLDKAEQLLLEVVHNTPKFYLNEFSDSEDSITIKFWDRAAFYHYISWQEKNGIKKSINWILNAYPRAFFYLGFICNERKLFEKAIKYLDQGALLEPTNPNFKTEKAQALMNSGRKEEALKLYSEIHSINPYISSRELALALRGQGYILIEIGQLGEAEIAFKKSLEFESDNRIAINELNYIKHLRQGGYIAPTKIVTSTSADYSTCPICGEKFSEGLLVNRDGESKIICKLCHSKINKKWWQRWK